ncbi:MAG TPA: hypothetical protein VGC41_02060 [Kofleriaceae bacterium]
MRRPTCDARRIAIAVVGGSLAGVGCIIPPSLSVDVQDAGIDSPPSITTVRSDLLELLKPGPYSFPKAPAAVDQTVTLTLLDTDVNDSLYARIFVDYSVASPTPPRSICPPATSNGMPIRTTTCSLATLCLATDDQTVHLMQIVVFDREPIDTDSETPFKAIPPGGQSTTRTYQLNCVDE